MYLISRKPIFKFNLRGTKRLLPLYAVHPLLLFLVSNQWRGTTLWNYPSPSYNYTHKLNYNKSLIWLEKVWVSCPKCNNLRVGFWPKNSARHWIFCFSCKIFRRLSFPGHIKYCWGSRPGISTFAKKVENEIQSLFSCYVYLIKGGPKFYRSF